MATQVNGDAPHSAFLDHLLKYPVVSDSVDTVKNNRFGQQGIKITDTAYQRLARPVLPYFARPYEYVSPYVRKADNLGDNALSRVDERFPLVTRPTSEVYQETWNAVLFPYHKSLEGRDHFLSVYNSEYKNVGGEDGIFRSGRALVATALVVTGESIEWARDVWVAKQKDVYTTAQEKAEQFKEKAEEYKKKSKNATNTN